MFQGPRHRKKNKKVPCSLNTSSSSNSNKGNISAETNLSITNENSRQLNNKFEQSSSLASNKKFLNKVFTSINYHTRTKKIKNSMYQ